MSQDAKPVQISVRPLPPGTYYAPLFLNPKTGNEGFICVEEMMTQYTGELHKIANKYKARLKSFWGLEYTRRRIRLKVPESQSLYPMFQIEEGGTILPFAAIRGPLYEQATGKSSKEPNHDVR